MGNLSLQLRELSKDRWEDFVQQYLNIKYPGADIKRSEGPGGDGGVDSFYGNLSDLPAIWQCKHFATRIKVTQQKQILKSIKTAFKKHTPSRWVLCVPIDLRTDEHSWFQKKIVAVYGGTETIKLLQASDFFAELMVNRILRDSFFPEEAISQMQDLRRIVTATDGRSDRELGAMVTEYAQQYLESAMKVEPRLRAILVVGGDSEHRRLSNPKGTIFSVTDGEMTTHIVPRDREALREDPITFSLEFDGVHGSAFSRALDYGKEVTLPVGSISHFASSSPLLNLFLNERPAEAMELRFTPLLHPALTAKALSLTVIADPDGLSPQRLFVPFKAIRSGRKEVEFGSDTRLPCAMNFLFRFPVERGGKFNFTPRLFTGADIQEARRVVLFLESLESSGSIRVIEMETDAVLLDSKAGAKSTIKIPGEVRKAIVRAAQIADITGVKLKLPEAIDQTDLKRIYDTLQVLKRETSSNMEITVTVIKDSRVSGTINEYIGLDGVSFRAEYPQGMQVDIFGTQVNLPPSRFGGRNAHFADAEKAISAYEKGEEGDELRFLIVCKGPCSWSEICSEE